MTARIKRFIPTLIDRAAWDACGKLCKRDISPHHIIIKFGSEAFMHYAPSLINWSKQETFLPYRFPEDPYPFMDLVAIWAMNEDDDECELELIHLYELQWYENLANNYSLNPIDFMQEPSFDLLRRYCDWKN